VGRLVERAPDLGRIGAAGDRDATDAGHRHPGLGVAHPDGGGQERRVAHEPGVAPVLGGARLARRRHVRQGRRGAGAALHVGFQDLGGEARGLLGDDLSTRGVVLVDHVAVAVGHALDDVGPVADPTVGQHRGRPRHVDGVDLLGADRQRQVPGIELGGDAHGPGQRDHPVETHELAEAQEAAVRRRRGGRGDGAVAAPSVGVVVGHVGVRVAPRVGERARTRAVDDVVGDQAGLEGGGEHEDLERRARLAGALGRQVVAIAVEARSPDHGPHRARLGGDRHQGGGELPAGVGQDVVAGRQGEELGLGAEGGLDAQTALEEGVVPLRRGGPQLLHVEELLLDLLDEVVVGLGQHVDAGLGQRRDVVEVRFLLGDVAQLHDAVERDPPALPGDIGLQHGVIGHRVLDQAGQERGLAPVELVDVLAPVDLRRGLDPVGATAEVDLVQVALEDLPLAHRLLELDGEDGLTGLAVEVLAG